MFIFSLLVLFLIISVVINIFSFILIRIILNKNYIYEEWILNFKEDVSNTLEKMREIDRESTFKSSFNSTGEGAFESDDQVGQIFHELLDLIEELNKKIQ